MNNFRKWRYLYFCFLQFSMRLLKYFCLKKHHNIYSKKYILFVISYFNEVVTWRKNLVFLELSQYKKKFFFVRITVNLENNHGMKKKMTGAKHWFCVHLAIFLLTFCDDDKESIKKNFLLSFSHIYWTS